MTAGQEQPETWVEISWTAFEADDRSSAIPEATAGTSVIARTRGMTAGPELGRSTRVRTRSGRLVEGTVVELRPGYSHGFGQPLNAWTQMRDAIAAERKSAGRS